MELGDKMETTTLPKSPEAMTKMTQSNALAAIVPQILNAIGGGDRRTQELLMKQQGQNNIQMDKQKEQMFMRSIMSPGSGEITQDLIMQQAALYGVSPQAAMELFMKFDSHRKAKAQEKRQEEIYQRGLNDYNKEQSDLSTLGQLQNTTQIGSDPGNQVVTHGDPLGFSIPERQDSALSRLSYPARKKFESDQWNTLKQGQEQKGWGRSDTEFSQGQEDRKNTNDWNSLVRKHTQKGWDEKDLTLKESKQVEDAVAKVISMGQQADYRGYLSSLPINIQRKVQSELTILKNAGEDRYLKNKKLKAEIQKTEYESSPTNPKKTRETVDQAIQDNKYIQEQYKGKKDIEGNEIPGHISLKKAATAGDTKALRDYKTFINNERTISGTKPVGENDLSKFDNGGKAEVIIPMPVIPVEEEDKTTIPKMKSKQPITQMSAEEIKNIYKFGAGDRLGTTPVTSLQKFLKTDLHPTNAALPGEGDNNSIEMTLRTLGIEKDLQKQKVIAEMLRKKFPDATEDQIVEMINQAVKSGF